MEIRQLRAFVAIAETGTFTAAAERVHVTQAAISMQIRQLELETGAKLFVRAPRRVILTEAGEKLLDRAQLILREYDAALDEMAALTGAEKGRMRIGSASAMVSADPLPQILGELRNTHPGVETSVASGTSEDLVQRILSGELDAAFVSLPVDARGVQTEMLSEDSLVRSRRRVTASATKVVALTRLPAKIDFGRARGNTRRLIDQFFARRRL
jgi:DNA-binding transcriptional LysR family regulator